MTRRSAEPWAADRPSKGEFPRPLLSGWLLTVLVFGPLAFGATEPWSAALLTAGLCSLPLLLGPRARVALPRLGVPALLSAIGAVVLVGVLQAANARTSALPSSWLPFTGDRRETIVAIALWCGYAGILSAVPCALPGESGLTLACWAIVLLGAFISVEGMIQYAAGNTALYGLRRIPYVEAFGPYTDRDHAANLLAMCAPIGVGLVAESVSELRAAVSIGRRADAIAKLVLRGLPTGLTIAALAFIGCRGAAAALFLASLAVSLAWIVEKRRAAAAGLVAAVLVVAATLVMTHPRLVGWGAGGPDHPTAYRLSMISSGLRQFRDFPLWGAGLGAAMSAFPAYQERFVSGVVTHVHDDWLELLMEVGIVGGGAFLLFLGWALRDLVGGAARTARPVLLGLAVSVLAFVFHATVDFPLRIPANAVVFFFLCALLSSSLAPGGRASRMPAAFGFFSVPAVVALLPLPSQWTLYRVASLPSHAARAACLSSLPPFLRDRGLRLSLAAEEVQISDSDRTRGLAPLRAALKAASDETSADSVSPESRGLMAAALWRLGRVEDAQVMKAGL